MQYSRLSKQYGMEIYLKKEHLHYTGSVKERGVLYQLTCLTQVTREKKDPFSRGQVRGRVTVHTHMLCHITDHDRLGLSLGELVKAA